MSSLDVRPGQGQGYSKFGAARLRLESDFAVVVSDKASYNVEAQTGAHPYRLRREERLEDPFPDVCRDAGSVIDDAQYRALTFAACHHFDAAIVRDGIKGVINQVRPYLVEFAGKATDARKAGLHVDDNDD
jgi:hypothetical protein